ncbi:MAG: hypothetical protein IPJ20_20635 [Flammeovirgaceae bacterium]|nr:hypothetical protein [Flammeovirgaceae bacterium]
MGNRIVNNIFRANTGYVVEYQYSNVVPSIVESDYNNLFTSGSFIGIDGSAKSGTLGEWQTAVGFEANAVSFDPQYQSDTNLYASAPGIASAGKIYSLLYRQILMGQRVRLRPVLVLTSIVPLR